MRITIEAWRQADADDDGRFESYVVDDATAEMSLLDVLDRLNDHLVDAGEQPIAFDSDCREGVCGACGMMVNGRPHGPTPNTPSCRQHLRHFDGATHLRLEPLRASSFPVIRDLVVDRSALDRVIEAGGHVAVAAGQAPDADAELVDHNTSEKALDYAACIGCGACVAACPNGAAHLFAGAKLLHLAALTQSKQERGRRAHAITGQMEQDFGPCSTYGECADVCPAGIPLDAVAGVNREALRFGLRRKAN
ncbi:MULTISPECIES: succinate dehydrogenase/fumarate reductase iron-sulfur subunit [Gordonia]|uniref:succinate dehydrogenase/fumarate reductase iron-sulfur subunit n=1 Tax=Gordonia TaxID=2053 RepID=UPI0007EB0BE2|nr:MULTISPECIES: succinate dehydrogenase/fumarate reductase iron-sulfur subunit [Gordonia]MCM3894893.1 succinate dehydrogenase/fumarate reductase iron-sulfur subunit [Gordonia sputi]OBA43320.1 succinate dehydrogenase [Gordonia sp. 852002-51296_SCH5728562-b]OBA65996.1 succinate dehydrogenase [Gordonia sp. 852002-10350_SCH5691597]